MGRGRGAEDFGNSDLIRLALDEDYAFVDATTGEKISVEPLNGGKGFLAGTISRDWSGNGVKSFIDQFAKDRGPKEAWGYLPVVHSSFETGDRAARFGVQYYLFVEDQ